MKKIFLPIFAVSMLFMAFQCEDDTNLTKEKDQKELTTLKQTIEDLADTSVCNENTECKFIAFGSKACGGPKSYLIYSTSIDVGKLKTLVESYNQKDADFNRKHGIISDCAVVNPPTSLSCKNNICMAIY